MVVSWFAILLLVGLIGLVALILGNRNARRVLAGLVIGVVVIFVFALLALVVMRTGVRRSTSSPSLSSRYQYPPEDEAMESHAVRRVTIGSNGDVVREGSSSIVVNGNGVSVTDEWIDAGQADFEADVYPSERSAAIAAARQMVRGWERILPAGQEPTQVLVSGDSELEPNVVPAVIQALRARLGDDRVEADKTSHGQYLEHVHNEVLSFNRGSQATAPAGSAPARLEADRTQIELLLEPAVREAQTRLRASEAGGSPASSAPAQVEADFTVHVLIKGDFSYAYGGKGVSPSLKKGGGINIEYAAAWPAFKGSGGASFENKPWVEYGIDRASQVSGQERMVARSKRLCPTRGEAEQQAIADATDKLVPLVSIAIERLDAAGKNEPLPGITTMRRLQSAYNCAGVIRADLLRGSGVKDQFTQQLRKPYGDVWQHAVLIDASDKRITSYAQTFMSQITQEHTAARQWRAAWIGRTLGLGLLTVLIVVLYAFLNAATRGYYTWMLRGSMVLLVLGGAIVLLLMT